MWSSSTERKCIAQARYIGVIIKGAQIKVLLTEDFACVF